MGPECWGQRRPSVIHAVHGVSANGSWFLLAQVEVDASKPECCGATSDDDGWLVMFGGDERDIITLRGQRA